MSSDDRINFRVSSPLDMAELDKRAAAVGMKTGPYVREVALGRIPIAPPLAEMLRLTLVLRDRLDKIDDGIADAQDLLSQIEEVAGLVAPDGSRIDDVTCKIPCPRHPEFLCERPIRHDDMHRSGEFVWPNSAPAVTAKGQTCVEKCKDYPKCAHATQEDAPRKNQQTVRQK